MMTLSMYWKSCSSESVLMSAGSVFGLCRVKADICRPAEQRVDLFMHQAHAVDSCPAQAGLRFADVAHNDCRVDDLQCTYWLITIDVHGHLLGMERVAWLYGMAGTSAFVVLRRSRTARRQSHHDYN